MKKNFILFYIDDSNRIKIKYINQKIIGCSLLFV